MRVLVGDETGLLKSIELEKNEQRVICSRAESQARARGVERLSWYQDENQDAACRENVVVARANSVVEYYSAQHVKDTREPEWSFTGPTGKTVGLDLIQKYGSVVRCTDAGDVFIKNTLSKGKPATFNVGPDLERMRLEPTEQTHIATGGKERDLNIWSLERQEAIFKAKNVTHDKLDMRVPVWVKDLHFLSQGSSNGHRVVVGTGHRHLRLYDTNTKRRPVQQIEFGEYPINAMCVSPDETRVFVADTTGCLDIFDLRMLRHMGRLTGPNGAIRDIACHPTLPYVAAVGLDRFVHVFDVNTRKYQHMIYAKQRLNAVLFCNDGVKDVVDPERASKRRKEHHGDEAEPMDDDEDDDDEEEEAYEGLEISDAEEEDDDDEDDEEEDEENFHFNDDDEDSD
ncbi:hypothetical protein Poli38472_001095 [Pythium oligandrum]|uniref:Ribosome biogenesis protein NSA1 n=1 Tax=Pythium oligandrum TaxID=41045 RepID=A0A8K1FQ14_PYTOL|nr:hypothetical protein Poli38472_001095 [Pythium oligandrum]|eukprot:TMW68939.1 hypothetical protein Poli38472_001095 [Pythium oligandrum]